MNNVRDATMPDGKLTMRPVFTKQPNDKELDCVQLFEQPSLFNNSPREDLSRQQPIA